MIVPSTSHEADEDRRWQDGRWPAREDFVRRQDPETRQAPVDERIAHRALGLPGPRAGAGSMSQQARDRLYERMFPREICGGGDEGSE